MLKREEIGMESLSCSLDLRSFQALLNAIAKKTFYNEGDITNEYLLEQLYSGTELEESVAINEINTMPGFTGTSVYPKLWQATGVGYTQLISALIDAALSA